MNLPNKITLTRIFMIPVFVVLFYLGEISPWFDFAAALVFWLAAFTDFLDGYIARSRNIVTDLGKFLDPIADKVLVSTAFIVLLTRPAAFTISPFGAYGLWAAGIMVAVILARELIVSGFRLVAAGKNLVLAADHLGKIKTFATDVALGLLIGCVPFLSGLFGQIVAYAGWILFVFSTVMTVISGVNYIVKNRAVLRDGEAE